MIAYLCNKCKKPINMKSQNCVHIKISYGERAITSSGLCGDSWTADLCEECFKEICPLIDEYYYGGNKYLMEENNETNRKND
jgi:hypothetical protein